MFISLRMRLYFLPLIHLLNSVRANLQVASFHDRL
jgi:hypothetical protein